MALLYLHDGVTLASFKGVVVCTQHDSNCGREHELFLEGSNPVTVPVADAGAVLSCAALRWKNGTHPQPSSWLADCWCISPLQVQS